MLNVIERWMPVVGYEGVYSVSDHGRVKSLARPFPSTKKEKILKGGKVKGYRIIGLCWYGVRYQRGVHRLVLDAFVGSSELECNHINGIKDDNRLENLEWVTKSENMLHSIHILGNINPSGEDNASSKLTENDVISIRYQYASGVITYKDLGVEFKVSQGTIGEIVRRRTWKHVN